MEYRRDVSFSLAKVGDVLFAQDELAGALNAYRESLDIRRALAAKDPGHAGLRRELCAPLNKFGNVLAAQSHIVDARAAIEGVAPRASPPTYDRHPSSIWPGRSLD